MKRIKLKAMAKINLALDVIGRRKDGYHDLRMIMQSVRLCDRIRMTVTDGGSVRIKTNLRHLPTGQSNLAFRACSMLTREFGICSGILIELDKRIPIAAGLAGGSSDAAAVLIGMNILFDLGLSLDQLQERGVKIGADVPYCITRGTALAEGIGDRLTQLPSLPNCYIVIVKPDISISTKNVYSQLRNDAITIHPDIDRMIEAIRSGNLKNICGHCVNVLETVTVPRYPQIADIKRQILECGALSAAMSGSGPSVFGIFDDKTLSLEACDILNKKQDHCRIFLTKPFSPNPH